MYRAMKYDLFDLLNNWNVIDKSRLPEESEEAFSFRLKVQKAAYLLHYLKVQPFDKIDFNQYLHGPYAPELAKTYFRGEPLEFDAGEDVIRKLEWFIKHDNVWLEIASSILLTYELYAHLSKKEVLDIVRLSKPWVKEKMFDEIYEDLSSEGLIAEKPQSLLS